MLSASFTSYIPSILMGWLDWGVEHLGAVSLAASTLAISVVAMKILARPTPLLKNNSEGERRVVEKITQNDPVNLSPETVKASQKADSEAQKNLPVLPGKKKSKDRHRQTVGKTVAEVSYSIGKPRASQQEAFQVKSKKPSEVVKRTSPEASLQSEERENTFSAQLPIVQKSEVNLETFKPSTAEESKFQAGPAQKTSFTSQDLPVGLPWNFLKLPPRLQKQALLKMGYSIDAWLTERAFVSVQAVQGGKSAPIRCEAVRTKAEDLSSGPQGELGVKKEESGPLCLPFSSLPGIDVNSMLTNVPPSPVSPVEGRRGPPPGFEAKVLGKQRLKYPPGLGFDHLN